jgi:hypothetical protein
LASKSLGHGRMLVSRRRTAVSSTPVRDLSLSLPPAARMVCEPASESAKSRIVLDQVAACAPTVTRSSVCIPAGSVSEIAANVT